MISFIIPAIESDEKYLYSSLDSLYKEIFKQNGSSEIILVLKCRKEMEEKFKEKLFQRYGDLISCYFSDGNISEARNLGLRKARNKILTFIDADTQIGENFISITIEDFKKGYGYVNYSTRPLREEYMDKRRLHWYTRFMNLNQWFTTKLHICRPYGFSMSVRKDLCENVSEDEEVFMKKLSGYGEDAEFGSRYGFYCRSQGLKGKYEKRVKVYTSLREWYKQGLWKGGVRMIINTWFVPFTKRPMVANWKDKN